MKCPKCGNEQAETVECIACGLIFEKYRRSLERRTQENRQPVIGSSQSRSRFPLIIWGVVATGVLLGGFLLLGRQEVPPTLSLAQAGPPGGEMAEGNRYETLPVLSGPDFQAQLNENTPPGNPIEQARNATVLLKTPWGLGSGFFIDEACSIITNRHVVKLGEEEVAKVEAQLKEKRNKAKSLHEAILANKASYQKYIAKNSYAASKNSRIKDYKNRIASDEQALKDFEQKIQNAEEEFNRLKWNTELIIILADGTELTGMIDQVSDEHDLALVDILNSGHCPAITIGEVDGLRQGDRLYTIGSPMGIRHTVTSGIYSGSIQLEGYPMLQTDAPINPGNSGGPLINQDGKVVGINTLVMNSAQGIGFAIPIDLAMKSFRLSEN